jgi:hypothetical protein
MRHLSSSALPSSLSGLKRLAKSIRRQQEIPHFQALNQAAQNCGYQDYHHARRVMERLRACDLPSKRSNSIYLSAYWRDRSAKPFQWGLETLKIELPSPLHAIVKKHQCGSARNLEAFYIEFEDHLEMRGDADSQGRARELLCRAALTLQFMEATGLRPATTKLQRKGMLAVDEFPKRDHLSRWVAPSGQWVALDEPYDHVTEPSVMAARAAWVESRGLFWARPTWSGLYYPNHAVPHLICADKGLLQQVVKTIEAMPDIVCLDRDKWQGTTADYRSQFVSPAREAAGAKRKSRPGTTYGTSKNAIEYWRRPGFKPLWRPYPSMHLANHVALGKIFQRLSVSGLRIDAYDMLGGIRSELEDWMVAENSWGNRKCTRDEEDAYYSGIEFARYRTAREQLRAVDRVHAILTLSYLDCAPLRKMLQRLDAARAVVAASVGS